MARPLRNPSFCSDSFGENDYVWARQEAIQDMQDFHRNEGEMDARAQAVRDGNIGREDRLAKKAALVARMQAEEDAKPWKPTW